MKMLKVVIDPGHGQYSNKGVLGYYEGTWMWHLGQYLQRELEARGWQVTNTRPVITDNPDLPERGQMAAGHDLFISVHSNAPGSSTTDYSSIRGVTIYDSVADQLDYLELPLVALIAQIMGTPNRGVNHRLNTRIDRQGQDYYGVLRNATTVAGCPDAMLIEHGYHTNERDAGWLMNHDNLKRLAAAEGELIDRKWREKHGLWTEDDMIYCKYLDPESPETLAVQSGLIKLEIEMRNPSTGKLYTTPGGNYGDATKAGVAIFKQRYGLEGDGAEFDSECVTAMLEAIGSLQTDISPYTAKITQLTNDLANVNNLLIVEQNASSKFAAEASHARSEHNKLVSAFETLLSADPI
jgi:N-acetylmuramoyl-L-alanine amidase